MSEAIGYIEKQDDVEKTKYEHLETDGDRVVVEMWHNSEQLQEIFEKVLNETWLSQKAIQKFAEEQAIAVRKTTVKDWPYYPGISEQLKDKNENL